MLCISTWYPIQFQLAPISFNRIKSTLIFSIIFTSHYFLSALINSHLYYYTLLYSHLYNCTLLSSILISTILLYSLATAVVLYSTLLSLLLFYYILLCSRCKSSRDDVWLKKSKSHRNERYSHGNEINRFTAKFVNFNFGKLSTLISFYF